LRESEEEKEDINSPLVHEVRVLPLCVEFETQPLLDSAGTTASLCGVGFGDPRLAQGRQLGH
jgi:hypothetical protein